MFTLEAGGEGKSGLVHLPGKVWLCVGTPNLKSLSLYHGSVTLKAETEGENFTVTPGLDK